MMARLSLRAGLAGRIASGPAEPFAAPTITAPPPDSSASAAANGSGRAALLCSRRLRLRRRRGKKEQVALDDGGGDVAELAPVVLGVVAQHLERTVGVDRVAGHQDAFRLLDQRTAPERPLQALILAEALERDVDRALQFLRGTVDDVGEDAPLR